MEIQKLKRLHEIPEIAKQAFFESETMWQVIIADNQGNLRYISMVKESELAEWFQRFLINASEFGQITVVKV